MLQNFWCSFINPFAALLTQLIDWVEAFSVCFSPVFPFILIVDCKDDKNMYFLGSHESAIGELSVDLGEFNFHIFFSSW